MLPQAEALSLKDEPLPLILTEDDEWLPSRIYQTDLEIAKLQEEVKDLQRIRADLLSRAIKTDIREDRFCAVTEKVKTFRKLDVSAFRAKFPSKFEIIRDMLRADLEEQIAHAGEKINLGLVDKMVKKHELGDCVTTTESRSYTVERKKEVL